MDQGGQRRDQVDATVVPNVRRQRGTAPASCARLQPRQFAAHAGDAEPIKDWSLTSPEGKSDQDQSSTRGGTRRSLHLARNYQLAQHKREDTGGER